MNGILWHAHGVNEDANRAALGRYVKQLRMEKFGTVDAARAAADVSRGTWDNVESGRRVKDFSLAAIAKALGVRAQTFDDMAKGLRGIPGETYRMVINDDSGSASVGGDEQGDDTLLFRRPDGISDEEWDDLKSRERDHWEWLIERASRER